MNLSRRTLTRTAAFAMGLGAVGSVAAACGRNKEAQNGDDSVVRWGFFRNYQPAYVGIAAGLFEKEGLKIDLSGALQSGSDVVAAAAAGEIDAGHSAVPGIAGAVAAGFGVRGVADSQTEFTDAPLQQWFVRDDSDIRGISDLKGRTIGTNAMTGSFYSTAVLALEKEGLTPDDVRFVKLGHDKQEQALLSGQIDVAGVIDPYSVVLGNDPTARRLFTGADILGEKQFSLLFLTTEFIDKRPDVAEAFVRGYTKSIELISEDPKAANKMMAKALGLDESVMVTHRYTPNAEIRIDDVQFWIEAMRNDGELTDAPNLRASNIVDLRFQAK